LKSQVITAMIFNGHTHETIAELDEVTMAQLQTMYGDGLVGNQGLLNVLGVLTNGVFNYMRAAGASPYKLANILGNAYDYLYPPLTEEQQRQHANDQLLAFMSQAPGFTNDRFGVKDAK
jgi:hypothetical protein